MSRSRKKAPAGGIPTSESEKRDKVASHQVFRAKEAQALLNGEEPPEHMRDAVNPWSMSKDGKRRFCPLTHPHLMRK